MELRVVDGGLSGVMSYC